MEQRKELTAKLRALGMSLRAIAKAENVSHETARNDLAGVNNLTPEAEPPAKVTGADGKQYPARRPASVITTTPRQTQAALDILANAGIKWSSCPFDVDVAELAASLESVAPGRSVHVAPEPQSAPSTR